MSGPDFLGRLLDGAAVEWMALGEVAEIYGGLTGKVKADFDGGNAKYITYKNIYSNPKVDLHALEPVKISDSERQNAIAYGDVLFTASSETADEVGMSGAVTTPCDDPIYLNSFSFGLRFKEGIPLEPEFSKHLFRSSFMRTEISKTASGVTRFNVSKDRFRKVRIPIPCPDNPEKSLGIQAEIVRILDTFTAVTSELTSELTARKKQYQHYRDQLLRFEDGEVEWKTLGDVAEVRSGWGFPNAYQGHDDGQYPFYKVSDMNIAGNETTMNKANNYIDAKAVKKLGIKPAPAGTVIFPKIGAAVATNKKRLLSMPSAYDNNVMGLIPGGEITARFLFYWLQTIDLISLANDSGAVPSIRKSEMESVPVPVPPPAEQARIVALLDKFDALTNSISEGLPREIALRRQQYAHYRDRLLAFPKPTDMDG